MHDALKVTFVCDPLLSEYGPLRPAILIAKKLLEKGKHVKMVSTTISAEQEKKLNSMNIQTINLGKEPLLKKNESIAWLEEWVKEAAFAMNSRGINPFDGVVVNFSNTISLPAHVWYAQGPPTVTLDNMKKYLPLHYRIVYSLLSPFFKTFDKSFTRRIAERSAYVVANSKYLTTVYNEFGVNVNGVIYPPLDCEQFRPMAPSPSEDFILTYFGKETIFSLTKHVLDMGIKVKAFGGKLALAPRKILEHPNLDFLGRISDEQLIDLYSNALFTFYPFTDEPFGYIPIESLACGTPVLTFNKQGPKETVSDGKTGWLANDDMDLLRFARRVWKKGYTKNVRRACRQSAVKYDVDAIASDWSKLLDGIRS
jgi:glycosyltransferase involved in cell wall biosynthesis